MKKLFGILVLILAAAQDACVPHVVITPPSQIYRALDTRTWVVVLNNSTATICDITDSRGGSIARVAQGQKATFPLGVYTGREVLTAQCYTGSGNDLSDYIYVGYDSESISVRAGRPGAEEWIISRLRVVGR